MAQDSGIDLASLLSSVQSAATLASDTMTKLTSLGAEQQNDFDAMASAALAGTDSRGETALSKQTKLLGELEAQNKKSELYQSLGMGGEGASKISNELATRYNDSLHKALQLSDSVKQRESIGFMDNPLAYLWNQLILPDEKSALAATVSDAKLASDGMKAINTMAQDTAQTEEAYKQTLTTASMESLTAATAAEINSKAANIRIQAAQSNAQNLAQVMSMNAQQINMLHTGVAAKQSARQLALSEQAAARSAEQFSTWQKETQDTEDYYDKMAGYVAIGAAATGRPAMEATDIKRALKGKATSGMLQDVQVLADLGWKNSQGTASEFKYGDTPAGAIMTANALKLPIPTGISAIQQEVSARVDSKMKTNPALAKDKAALSTEFNSQVQAVAKQMQDKVDYRDTTNQYIVPSTKILTETAAVKGTALYKQVLAQEVTTGGLDTTNPEIIINKGLAAVKEGKLTLGQLGQDIVTYYSTGVQVNNTQKQFVKYGVPAQATYNAEFKVLSELAAPPGSVKEVLLSINPFSGKSTITKDLTDLTQVNSLLVKMYKVEAGSLFGGTK